VTTNGRTTGGLRHSPFALLAAFVLVALTVGVLAAMLFAPPTSSFPRSRLIAWRLADGFLGTPKFDAARAQTMTTVPISVDWLVCAPQDDSWLGPPEVSYTPWSVTITMHTTDAFAARSTCGGNGRPPMGWVLDVGIPVAVQLRAPLAGRALFDGSGPTPRARPYGEEPRRTIHSP
jgi:hypothetical protein